MKSLLQYLMCLVFPIKTNAILAKDREEYDNEQKWRTRNWLIGQATGKQKHWWDFITEMFAIN